MQEGLDVIQRNTRAQVQLMDDVLDSGTRRSVAGLGLGLSIAKYLQLQLDGDGNGEGKASLLTRIDVDATRHAIVLENFASQPVDLMSVRSLGSSRP